MVKDLLEPLLIQMGKENMNFYLNRSLDPISRLAQQAGLLDWDIPIISVTGTNGKGSTVAALSAIYKSAGYRVGVFTSPHLLSYNERIKVNDETIDDDDFLRSIQFISELDKAGELSFFPKMFLIALHYFKSQDLDALILEVGVGGRLDAINILDADLVIIASVDIDHEAYLGNTIEAIAREKAGLFRPGKKAIFADIDCPKSIIARAEELKVDLLCFKHDYQLEQQEGAWGLSFQEHELRFNTYPKIHMQAMLSAIVAALVLQARLPVLASALNKSVAEVFIPGRQQWISQDIPILMDVSHNPHAVHLLVKHIQSQSPKGNIHAVFSVLKDKNGHKIVELFNKLSPLWYTTVLDSERSHNEESLKQVFAENQVEHQFFKTPTAAFEGARQQAKSGDCIVVFGSFVLVSNIMQKLQQEGVHVF